MCIATAPPIPLSVSHSDSSVTSATIPAQRRTNTYLSAAHADISALNATQRKSNQKRPSPKRSLCDSHIAWKTNAILFAFILTLFLALSNR